MRIKNKKILSTLILGGLLIVPTTFSISGNIVSNQLSGLVENNSIVKNETEVKNNSVTPTFGQDNKNQSNITPNGILSVNNNVVNLTLYNNIAAWSFDIMKSDFMLQLNSNNTKPTSISNVGVKYNTYTGNTVFVYGVGHYPGNGQNGQSEEVSFLFQINLSSGTPYLLNNNYSASILTSRKNPNALTNSIDWVVLNQNDGTFFVFSKSQNTMQKTITKFSSINYSTVNIDSSNFVSMLNSNKLINVANLYGNYFSVSTVSNQQQNGTNNVDFYIFDFNLTQLTAKQTINSSQNVENSIADPIAFANTNKSIITIVLPFLTDGFTNNIDIAKKMNIFRFSPNESDSANNGKKKIEMVSIDIGKSENTTNGGSPSNQYAYGYRVDEKNKRLFVSTVDNNSQKLYCYTLDDMGKYSNVYEITNFTSNGQTKAGEKKLNSFFIVNDPYVDTNSYLIREELTYSNNNKDSLSSVNYFKGKITVNGNATLTDVGALDAYVLKDINASIEEEKLHEHLPSDLKEDNLIKMVKLVNSKGQEISGATKNLAPSAPIVLNDLNGSISVVIQYTVKNWWATNNSISFSFPISASGFYTRDSLSFKLIKNANDDSSKWNQINSLKSKLPSKVTKQDIMKSFYTAGSNLNPKITEDKITITSAQKEGKTDTNAPAQTTPIHVIIDDDNGTLQINYNLTTLSSPNMPVENIIGSYRYSGFLRSSGWDKVTLNSNLFNSIKSNKLAYQITKKEIIDSLNLSSYYSRSENDWDLVVDNQDQSTAEFKQNLIDGKMSFTITYKATQNGVPSTIPKENYTVKVGGAGNQDGNGFMTLDQYVGDKITLDATRMNELTSSMSTDDIKKNINKIVADYSTTKNNWVDVSNQFKYELNASTSTDTKLVFTGTPNQEVTTNIDIVLNENNVKLKLDNDFQTKLLQKKPNLFNDLKTINVNANITVYNWNHGISTSVNTVTYRDLFNESNPANMKYNYVLPSIFVDSFENNPDYGRIEFQKTFNLLKEYSKLDQSGQIDKTDVTYYEIKYVQLIPDNESGSVIANYTVEYPNIKNSSGFTVTINPQMIISGFKTTGQVKGDLNIILLSVVISLVVLAIFTIIVMRIKRNKFVNADKNKGIKYSKIKKIK